MSFSQQILEQVYDCVCAKSHVSIYYQLQSELEISSSSSLSYIQHTRTVFWYTIYDSTVFFSLFSYVGCGNPIKEKRRQNILDKRIQKEYDRERVRESRLGHEEGREGGQQLECEQPVSMMRFYPPLIKVAVICHVSYLSYISTKT